MYKYCIITNDSWETAVPSINSYFNLFSGDIVKNKPKWTLPALSRITKNNFIGSVFSPNFERV